MEQCYASPQSEIASDGILNITIIIVVLVVRQSRALEEPQIQSRQVLASSSSPTHLAGFGCDANENGHNEKESKTAQSAKPESEQSSSEGKLFLLVSI